MNPQPLTPTHRDRHAGPRLPAVVASSPSKAIHLQARGRLYRAIVSLPPGLCPPGEPLHERIVFFDGPRQNAGEYLETLLAHAWHVDTIGWCEDGAIYNLQSAAELTEEGLSEHLDYRLLETGWGGDAPIHYADPARTDFFVAPQLKRRLLDLQARVQARAQQGGAA